MSYDNKKSEKASYIIKNIKKTGLVFKKAKTQVDAKKHIDHRPKQYPRNGIGN